MRSLPSLDPHFTISPNWFDGTRQTETLTLSYDGEDREITFSGTKLQSMEFQVEGRTLTITGCFYQGSFMEDAKSFETVLHLDGDETYAPATATISVDHIGAQYTIVEI